MVDYTCKLVSTQAATTTRRKKTVEKQAHLQKLWDEYVTAEGDDDEAKEKFLQKASMYGCFFYFATLQTPKKPTSMVNLIKTQTFSES